MGNIPEQIQEYYNQLESITTFDRWELMKQLDPMSEMFEFEWNNLLNAEHISLRFELREGQLISDLYSVDENGKENGFPSLDIYSEEQLTYLKERAKTVKNPILAARYNHILFCVLKNREFGINAIDAYKKLTNHKTEDDIYERFIPAIEATIKLTEKIKYCIETTKKELITLVNDDQLEIYQKHIISSLLINSPLFKFHELSFFPDLALQWVESKEVGYFHNKEILNNAIKVSKNIKIDFYRFFEKLAENELLILNEHPEESDFIRVQVLGEIVDYYKKAKNNEKREHYLREYTQAKSKIELQAFDISPNKEFQQILNEEVNRRVKAILSWDTDTIFYHFSVHTNLFPDIDSVIEIATRNYKKSFLQHVTSSVFDINNNIKTLSDEENLEKEIYNNYLLSLGIGALIELIRVLQVGTYNRKITYHHLFDYLSRNSWLGQSIEETMMRGSSDNKSYKWLNLMAPALHSFMIQMETSFLIGKGREYTNWILPLDSLTLKFEGALRDFIKIIGGNTSVVKRNELQEMLLDDLLASDTAKQVFSKNDLALFKMIFTKKGDNIRHNIAHGFYHTREYNMEKCCKVLLCILRLSAYKLVSSKVIDN